MGIAVTQYPLISIITAVRNGAPFLVPLIESVLQQDYPNFEHIIIDDGSTDGGATVQILASYPHLHWWSRENKGQYATQNEGIATARGELISVISADDVYFSPHTFSRVYECWSVHPEVELIYGKTLHMDTSGTLLPYQVDITGDYPKWLMRYYEYIQHCSLFISRSFLVQSGVLFDGSFKYAGDWDWISRLVSTSTQIRYLNEPLSIIRDHPNQTSRRVTAQARELEHRRVCTNNHSAYFGHLLMTKLTQYRAMTLIATATLRTVGVGGLFRLGNHWLHRKFAKDNKAD
jgi:glycosyltransferase involved in cell wall biosynthesis